MRRINITIEIEDSDYVELNLRSALIELLGRSMTDYKVIKDTRELYKNDPNFMKIVKAEKKAKKIKQDYIHKHNGKDT